MLAHLNGQTVNYSSLAGSLGVSHNTIRNYIELLHATFMLDMVMPFRSNTGKRLVKAPKIFISDTGIAAALLDLKDFNAISGHPVFGSLWESIVLTNVKGHFPHYDISFYRTSHGAEMDFLVSNGHSMVALECKSSLSPSLSKGTYNAIEDLNPFKTFVVAPVKQGYPLKKGIDVINLNELKAQLDTMLKG